MAVMMSADGVRNVPVKPVSVHDLRRTAIAARH